MNLWNVNKYSCVPLKKISDLLTSSTSLFCLFLKICDVRGNPPVILEKTYRCFFHIRACLTCVEPRDKPYEFLANTGYLKKTVFPLGKDTAVRTAIVLNELSAIISKTPFLWSPNLIELCRCTFPKASCINKNQTNIFN